MRIKAGRSPVALDVRELWSYRELFYFLTWRDVKVRYKQTFLGALWAVLQPICTMFIFSLLFGKLAGIPSNGVPYPIFAYAGIFIWVFFSNALMNSGNSLVGNSNLITKVYFPRLLVPGAAVAAGLVDFALAFIVLIGLMIYYGVGLTWNLAMLPVLILMTTQLAFGVGVWISALNVKYRDVRFALPFLIQLWFFCSPIIYPLALLPDKWKSLLILNPLTGIVEGFRSALFGGNFHWPALTSSAAITTLTLLYSIYSFHRVERDFADII